MSTERVRRMLGRPSRRYLALEHAKTRGVAVAAYNLLARGFWGRMKWLFLGK